MTMLDPDDPRPLSLQVANALRAEILTGQLAPGEKLPSQRELSERFGVAAMTVQQAQKILRRERLTVGRAGSGVYVRDRSRDLDPLAELLAYARAQQANPNRSTAKRAAYGDMADRLADIIEEPDLGYS